MKSLNNFVLYCKGWYVPTNPNIRNIDFVKLILKLDDYCWCHISDNDVISIILVNFSKYNDELTINGKNHLDIYKIYRDIIYKSKLYDTDDLNEILLYIIVDFIRWSDIVPNPPKTFDKKLYKCGIKSNYMKHGTTYKEVNKKVSNFFKKNI